LSAIAVFSFSSIFIIERTLTYFATQTRIWELSIGALVAIIGAKVWPQIMQWVAFLIILASLFFVGSADQVPGLKVVPVLLAVAVLLNVSNTHLNFILGNRVMHYIGDLSFVLYLWHWPVIELHRQLAVSPLSTSDLISLLVITFLLAITTHHLFENPIRFNKYLVQHPGVTVFSGTLAITLSVLASYLLVKG
jgi:peptidoglycan/LPS O-acetylase OafA/YrhL